jgi:WD40-like Beta Propeller Repeat
MAGANFSPDGQFMAYTSNESGRYGVYVETLSEDRTLMAVAVSSGAVLFGVPRPLLQTEVHAGVNVLRPHYVPSRDGSRFLVHTRSRDLAPVSITVVLNWTAGLKK